MPTAPSLRYLISGDALMVFTDASDGDADADADADADGGDADAELDGGDADADVEPDADVDWAIDGTLQKLAYEDFEVRGWDGGMGWNSDWRVASGAPSVVPTGYAADPRGAFARRHERAEQSFCGPGQ